MPERNDIELQARRAAWLLKYWRLAETLHCNRATAGKMDSWNGYEEDGSPLYEREDDSMDRERRLFSLDRYCPHVLIPCDINNIARY